ncbi:hypothetical protein AAFF_G00077400 [Aldrovandia affinis]|uniref:Uncharacterized protein n=1 Tax=Aldrovandia affinis TaxID=143900 RepID=A0AAD7R1U6_9TELE|nr:hypothetical protein AAFF_G00077400 [Aldrovandia affinis]
MPGTSNSLTIASASSIAASVSTATMIAPTSSFKHDYNYDYDCSPDNGTASNGNPTMTSSYDSPISCPAFVCQTSTCYDKFMNQTAFVCDQNVNFCELRRQADMNYLVCCSADCPSMLCVNQTQTGCAADCCNTTGCLNVTLFSMMPPQFKHDCAYNYKYNYDCSPDNGTASDGNATMTSSYDSPISCPAFFCNTSTCYDKFMNQNAIVCDQNVNFCELRQLADMSYLVCCSADCPSMLCVNQTQTGCAADCCNTTGCLNVTLFSMMPPQVAPAHATLLPELEP